MRADFPAHEAAFHKCRATAVPFAWLNLCGTTVGQGARICRCGLACLRRAQLAHICARTPSRYGRPLSTVLRPLPAGQGLLARVIPDEAQTLADEACELVDVPSVPVGFVRAPNRNPGDARGWYCTDTAFPLFRYPARIVLNRTHGGDNLRTLSHELAHHVVGVRGIREGDACPARRHRSHGHPFPTTYREMVGHVHTLLAARRELSC